MVVVVIDENDNDHGDLNNDGYECKDDIDGSDGILINAGNDGHDGKWMDRWNDRPSFL